MDVKNKRIKEFVFNGMLVEDSLSNLEQQGIKVIDDTNIKILVLDCGIMHQKCLLFMLHYIVPKIC